MIRAHQLCTLTVGQLFSFGQRFRNIMTYVEQSYVVMIIKNLIMQAVYTCCRSGKFDEAKAVYERIWKSLENENQVVLCNVTTTTSQICVSK